MSGTASWEQIMFIIAIISGTFTFSGVGWLVYIKLRDMIRAGQEDADERFSEFKGIVFRKLEELKDDNHRIELNIAKTCASKDDLERRAVSIDQRIDGLRVVALNGSGQHHRK